MENKPRYIDANYLEQFAIPIKDHTGRVEKVVQYEHIINAPTADVQEVKHAGWKEFERVGGFACSNCGAREKRSAVINGTHKFCYKCGAKMDGNNDS